MDEKKIIEIAKDIERKKHSNDINRVFDMMKEQKYSGWTSDDFREFLLYLVNI